MIAPKELLRYTNRALELPIAALRTPAVAPLVARYLKIGTPSYPFRLPLRAGGTLTLASRAEVTVFWQIFVHGCYTLPADCETILDCGANVGIFAVWAARQRPGARIVALEPFPDTYRMLDAHVKETRLDSQIHCVQMGVAPVAGEWHMAATEDSPTRKLLMSDDSPSTGTFPVKCVTLAECLRTFHLESLDLLKMDIEGSEWAVLLSTPPEVLRRIRHIQLEYHEVHRRFNYTPEKLFAHLASAGHRLVTRTEDEYRTGMASFELSEAGRSGS